MHCSSLASEVRAPGLWLWLALHNYVENYNYGVVVYKISVGKIVAKLLLCLT